MNADYRASTSDILCSLNTSPTDDDLLRQTYDDFAVRFEEKDLTDDAVVCILFIEVIEVLIAL